MRVLDPGHLYALDSLDKSEDDKSQLLRFVKRIGDKFPGNIAPPYAGTTT